MTLYLVRHAHAGRRNDWDGPDRLRPLSRRGRRQAAGLSELLGDQAVTRTLSSPYLRCVQTVEPLAARCGLEVEEAAELAEDSEAADTVLLLRGLANGAVVACTHGDVVPAVLDTLASRDGLLLPVGYRYAKGSTWELEAENGRFVRARYLPPPS